MVGDFHYPTDHQPDKSNLLGFDADGWPVLHSWSWILRQKETLFPYDLAPLHPRRFCSPIYRDCLCHVRNLDSKKWESKNVDLHFLLIQIN